MEKKNYSLMNVDIPSFVMAFPDKYSADVPNNIWMAEMTEEARKVDTETAIAQWNELYYFLSQQGLCTIMPSPYGVEGLDDLVFCANAGFAVNKETFIVSNFTSEKRIPEMDVIINYMNCLGFKSVVVCPYKFEGEAEIKYIGKLDGKDTFLGGYGIRSDIEAYEWMEREFDVKIIKVKMKNEKLYHFDCMCFPLTASQNLNKVKADVLMYVDEMSEKELEEVRKYCKLVHVPKAFAEYGVTNSVRVHNYVLCGSDFHDMDPEIDKEFYYTERDKNQWLEDVLSEFGMEPVFVNLSSYALAGGCLSCNVLHLNRFSYEIDLL